MTAWQWIIATVIALGGVVLAVAKADLEDPDVYRWIARRLVYRAALRLPRGERARWRDQAMGDVLDLPGRLPPLLWALDTYVKAGSWGRTRGAPSRWQVLTTRIQLAWQRLRSLRAAPSKALSKQRHPAVSARTRAQIQVQGDPAQAIIAAWDAQIVARSTTRSYGSATLSPPRETWATFDNWRPRRMLLDKQFVAWLAQERRDFEDHVDQKVDEYWRARDQELGL